MGRASQNRTAPQDRRDADRRDSREGARNRGAEVRRGRSGAAAALVEERVWHESQRLERLPVEDTLFEELKDEPHAVLATFRLSDLVEFKRWIKGFGEQAEVLKPTSLRREMREELLAASRRHGGAG